MNTPTQSGVSAARPFPGLRPFAYRDHEYFFGREQQTFALYRLIDRYRFIAVVGSSGSGKSSLVCAGLLPLLDTETRDTGGHNWLWRRMHPGDAPLRRLTNLLATLSPDDDPMVASARRERIAAHVQRSSFGIFETLAEIKGITGKSLVLVIDQFEELFRYGAASWAERYGGGFGRVQRLLSVSQRQRKFKRLAMAAAFVIAVGLAGAMFFLWQTLARPRLHNRQGSRSIDCLLRDGSQAARYRACRRLQW
jgi:hypothetical protein